MMVEMIPLFPFPSTYRLKQRIAATVAAVAAADHWRRAPISVININSIIIIINLINQRWQ